jgi:hypothetical protein
MGDAAMPGEHQQFILGEKITDDIRIRKNGSKHERPGDDASLADGRRGDQVVASKCGLGYQSTCDPVSDCVHN